MFETLNDLGEIGAHMGGLGSGWQGSRKTTVEDSLVLSMHSLINKRALVAGARTSGSWGWTRLGDEHPHASIGYEASLVEPDAAWLRLHYQANGVALDYKVQLVATRPAYGGYRWWFLCPLQRNDREPARRVAKLYLPPGGRYFGSRVAYGLTYTSCQESGKYRGLYRHLATNMGTDEATIRRALKAGFDEG